MNLNPAIQTIMNIPDLFLVALKHLPPQWVQKLTRGAADNRCVHNFLRYREKKHMSRAGEVNRVLCIADVNIGDAVNFQPVAQVFKRRFRDCAVDYVYTRTAHPIIRHNPAFDRHLPLFDGNFTPTDEEVDFLRQLVARREYDLVLSFCPFLDDRVLNTADTPVIKPLRMILLVLSKLLGEQEGSASLNRNIVQYVNELTNPYRSGGKFVHPLNSIPSPCLYISDSALRQRDFWMLEAGISESQKTVIFNPDASSKYTLVDERLQMEILRRIVKSDSCEQLLMAHGFSFSGIAERVCADIPRPLRRKISFIPPDLPIDAYAATMDLADVYVSGDTGPLHMAAAKKIRASGRTPLRNRTALCELFGSTLPQVYGYESHHQKGGQSGQDAPAKVFEGGCPNKTVGCSLARVVDQCNRVNCFQGIHPQEVADYVTEALGRRDRVDGAQASKCAQPKVRI